MTIERAKRTIMAKEPVKYGHIYRKKPYSQGGNHPYSTKVKAAQTYIATGNLSLTARLLDIPHITLKVWKKEQWWLDLIDELLVEDKSAINKNVKKIAEQALAVVSDRLQDGNYQYDQKNQQIVRVPVNARDAHRIGSDMLDQAQILEDRIQAIKNKEVVKTADTLQQIADSFAKLVKSEQKKQNEKVIDIEDAELKDIPT